MKKKTKKSVWWLKFGDGKIKKVYSETMTSAWKRGESMGLPVSISGSKATAQTNMKSLTAADPAHLIELLRYLCEPNLLESPEETINSMKIAAQEALIIVENFPKVIVEQ